MMIIVIDNVMRDVNYSGYDIITVRSSKKDVSKFLKQHDLDKFINLFLQEGINGQTLLALTDADLKEYGVIRTIDRKRILREIDQIRQGWPFNLLKMIKVN